MVPLLIKQWVGKYRLGTIDWLLTGLQGWKNEHMSARLTHNMHRRISFLCLKPSSFLYF
jgi:hypothetical protein